MKIVAVDPGKCVGCRLCELACSMKNTGEYNPARARIHVIGFDEMFCLPVTCFHCEKPQCAEICPTAAIIRDNTSGAIKVIAEKCTGCKMCTIACPFGNIVFSSAEKVAVKCQLCDGSPECVTFCPTGALEFRESDISQFNKQRTLSDKLKYVYQGIQNSL